MILLEHSKKLADCRVLLSNDDGIDAAGFAVLEAAANNMFAEVWVVAPFAEQSAQSRSLTVRHPIDVDKRGERRFAVHGTPSDCIVVALNGLLKNEQPDLVLSGVNHGSNLAEDIGYSGTVGCAMEASLHKIPAIAFSQCFPTGGVNNIPWEIAESHLQEVVHLLWDEEHMQDLVYNVNFPPKLLSDQNPDGPKLCFTKQGRRIADDDKSALRIEDLGESKLRVYIDWLRRTHDQIDGTDLKTVEQGHISVTKLGLEHGFQG